MFLPSTTLHQTVTDAIVEDFANDGIGFFNPGHFIQNLMSFCIEMYQEHTTLQMVQYFQGTTRRSEYLDLTRALILVLEDLSSVSNDTISTDARLVMTLQQLQLQMDGWCKMKP